MAHVVRVLVLLVWLGAVTVHAVRHTAGTDTTLAGALAAHRGMELRYRLRTFPGLAPIGTLTWRASGDRQRCETTTTIQLHDLGALPLAHLAFPLLQDPTVREGLKDALLTLVETFGRDGHLATAHGVLSLGGSDVADGSARLDADATRLTWRSTLTSGSLQTEPLHDVATLLPIACLPAHLVPGSRCSLRLAGIDLHRSVPMVEVVTLVVRDEEEVDTALGSRLLVRVDLLAGDRPPMSWWCDDSGQVWRVQAEAAGILAECEAPLPERAP